MRAANDAKIPEILKPAKTVRLKYPNPKAKMISSPILVRFGREPREGKWKKKDGGIRIYKNQIGK